MPFLNSSQKSKVLAKLQSRPFKCPNQCSVLGTQGEVGELIGLQLVEHGVPSGLALGNQFMPVIPVTCKTCGGIAWYSAASLVDLSA